MAIPHLTLVQNSVDFIRNATDQIVKTIENSLVTPRDTKYIVINLAIGLELLLKQLLWDNNQKSIFRDSQVPSKEKLEIGDFKTISYSQAYQKIDAVLIHIELTGRDKDNLNDLGDLRNNYVHHSIINIGDVNPLVLDCCKIAFELIRKELLEFDGIEDDINSIERNMIIIVRHML